MEGELLVFKQWCKLALISVICIGTWSGGTGGSDAAAVEPEAAAKPAAEWSRLYGTDAASSNGRSVIPTTDGGYIAVGEIVYLSASGYATDQKIYVVKLNKDGEITWETKIQADAAAEKSGGTAYSAIETRDGGYLISGVVTDVSGKSRIVPLLAKLDSQGNVEWDKSYDDLSPSTDLHGESIVESPDGGYLITGFSANSYAVSSAYLLKVDDEGNKVWYKTYRFDADIQYFNEIMASPDGGYVAVGALDSMITPQQDGSVIVKLDAQGEVEWEQTRTLPSSGRTLRSIEPSQDGGYVVSGMQRQEGEQIAFVSKIDTTGKTIWEKTYNLGTDNDYLTQLIMMEDGFALLGRHAYGSYPDTVTEYQVLHLDEGGEVTGTFIFEEPGLVNVGNGALASDGGLLLSGQIRENNSYRMQIIKVLGNGETLPEDPELSGLLFGSAEADLAIGEQKPSVITAVYSDGGTFDVSDSATYASWNPEIATVDDRGLLTGLSAGSTVITAGYGGMEAQLIVHVTDGTQGPNPVNGQFYLDSEDYSLSIGSELDIQAWFADEYGNARLVNGETEFTIADTAIATIDEQGFMTGLTPGRTTLTAVYQGRSYTSTVLVVRPYVPAEITEN